MNNAGKSVMWFFGACLALTQIVAGLSAKYHADFKTSVLILAYAFLCLVAILSALTYIYRTDPSFLLAENPDVKFLSALRKVENNPELLSEIIRHLDPRILEKTTSSVSTSISRVSIDETSKAVADDEKEEFAKAIKNVLTVRGS